MNKLKKLLALSLALTTILGSFAGNTAFAKYSDDKDILASNAVNMLSALNLLNGYTDGSFKPDAVISKAELAKIIYVLKNGGKDDKAANFVGMKTDLTDINGHWAEGYIKYGYTQGIIAGNGKGKFEPEKNVTGTEAAKMLLTILGYDADRAGLVGTQWDTNTLRLATDKNLFQDYNISFASGSTRQYASQMVYNSLFATMMTSRDSTFTEILNNGSVITLGEKYMGLQIEQGVLISNGEYSLDSSLTSNPKVITISKPNGANKTFEYSEDVSSLIGQSVSVVSNKTNGKIFGIYASNSNKMVKTSLGNVSIKNGKLFIDDKEVQFEQNAKAYTGETSESFALAFATQKVSGLPVTFISNDGNDTMDIAIISDAKVGKLTGVYKDNITTDISGLSNITRNDKTDLYEGATKDDIVQVTTNHFNNSTQISKLDTTSGIVSSMRTGEMKIGDTWYKLTAGVTAPTLNDNVKVSTLSNYIYNVEKLTEGTKDFMFVTAVNNKADLYGKFEARVLLSDGTEKVIKTDKLANLGSTVTYSTKDDVYTLTEVSTSNLAGYENVITGTNGYNADTKKLGSASIDDDATVFIEYIKDTKTLYKTIKGSELKKTAKSFGKDYTALTTMKNGFNYASVITLKSDTDIPNFAGKETTGYIISEPTITKVDNTTHISYDIWNGMENVTLLSEGSTPIGKKGSFILYQTLENGKISDVTNLGLTNGAITGFDKTSGEIMFSGDAKSYKLTKDTKVLFIDTKNFKGFEDGTINLADKKSDKDYINNASFKASTTLTNGSYELEVIVIDINNEIK